MPMLPRGSNNLCMLGKAPKPRVVRSRDDARSPLYLLYYIHNDSLYNRIIIRYSILTINSHHPRLPHQQPQHPQPHTQHAGYPPPHHHTRSGSPVTQDAVAAQASQSAPQHVTSMQKKPIGEQQKMEERGTARRYRMSRPAVLGIEMRIKVKARKDSDCALTPGEEGVA